MLPEFLRLGVKHAKSYKCGIRITGRLSALFPGGLAKSGDVVLDFSEILAYPDVPSISIEDNFKIHKVENLEAMCQLPSLAVLQLGQPLALDCSAFPALGDLRFNYSRKIKNVGRALNLERLYIWSYKGVDLSEFKGLVRLKDFMLVRPSIKSLDGIEVMTALETIDISYASKLEDVSALHRLNETHKVRNIALPKKFWSEGFWGV